MFQWQSVCLSVRLFVILFVCTIAYIPWDVQIIQSFSINWAKVRMRMMTTKTTMTAITTMTLIIMTSTKMMMTTKTTIY